MGDWIKKTVEQIVDKVLLPVLIALVPTALLVGLGQKTVPLWGAVTAFVIGVLLGYGLWYWRNRRQPTHPTDTIRIFPRKSEWSYRYKDHKAFREGKPLSAGLHFRCEVTNITRKPVRLIGAEISRGLHRPVEGWVLTRAADGTLFSSQHYIKPGHTTEVTADFGLAPPPWGAKPGRAIKRTVGLRDQWGNTRQVKGVVFAAEPPPRPAVVTDRPVERVHAIQDSIEKDVAAILKTEIDRYRTAGGQRPAYSEV